MAVLVNTAGPISAEGLGQSVAALVLGDRSQTTVFGGRPADYVGEYRGLGRGRELVLKVRADTANGLTLQFRDRPPARLLYYGRETFGVGSARYHFLRDGGQVAKVRADLVGHSSVLTRQPLTAERTMPP